MCSVGLLVIQTGTCLCHSTGKARLCQHDGQNTNTWVTQIGRLGSFIEVWNVKWMLLGGKKNPKMIKCVNVSKKPPKRGGLRPLLMKNFTCDCTKWWKKHQHVTTHYTDRALPREIFKRQERCSLFFSVPPVSGQSRSEEHWSGRASEPCGTSILRTLFGGTWLKSTGISFLPY